ncbi:RpiB/LacA/LacB family sugar-phosphate isomerase [Candidatus Dojkabacteria bacterium]|nr:RpiB/LacA/LacB family sugar-phosphate isomerase [Candidatus Dojkabacteria bacterium]
MNLFIASDHGGFHLKKEIKEYLESKGIMVEDLSPTFDTKDDYPDVAHLLAGNVAKEKKRGILICGTGIAMAITANKTKGIRAAPLLTRAQVLLARLHNDLNVLCLGGLNLKNINTRRLKSKDYKNLLDLGLKPNKLKDVKDLIDIFLETGFEGGRHRRRIGKIEKLYS